jgi:hypothetical protein
LFPSPYSMKPGSPFYPMQWLLGLPDGAPLP